MEGHIEKFAGDQVMVLASPAHEEDPVRAVKTADEIHQVVRDLSHQVQETIGQPLAVHIGINTGLVVTGELNSAEAAHHIAGDTVNVASRLCTLANAGETLVEHTTFTQAEGFSPANGDRPARQDQPSRSTSSVSQSCRQDAPLATGGPDRAPEEMAVRPRR
jgi:class 3 adenylate cyclase